MTIQRTAFSFLKLSALMVFVLAAIEAKAEDLKLKVQLIWGTDITKTNDPALTPVDPRLIGQLTNVFRWKNYYAVTNKSVTIAESHTENVILSYNLNPRGQVVGERCRVEIGNLGKAMAEVKLFGETKHVKTVKQSMAPGKCLVIAGDDKKENAWFVVLSPKKEK